MQVILWFVLLSIVPVATSVPASTSGSDLERLVGTWQCDGSATGNSSVETYEHGSDGSISLRNDVRGSSGTDGIVVETFTYDAASETWTATAPGNAFFDGFTLSADRWTGASWTLAGDERVHDATHRIRIVYTQLAVDVLRRQHQVDVAGIWQDDASYTCRRTSPVEPIAVTPTSRPQARIIALPQPTPRPTTTPTPTPTPRPSPTPRDFDRARTLAHGVWTCQTLAGHTGIHVYRTLPDGSIALANRLSIAGRIYEIDERYRYDRTRRLWTNETGDGAYRGTAPPWSGDDWLFSGVTSERGVTQPVRMIYRTLGDDAFRRDFQHPGTNGWVTYTSETCERK